MPTYYVTFLQLFCPSVIIGGMSDLCSSEWLLYVTMITWCSFRHQWVEYAGNVL